MSSYASIDAHSRNCLQCKKQRERGGKGEKGEGTCTGGHGSLSRQNSFKTPTVSRKNSVNGSPAVGKRVQSPSRRGQSPPRQGKKSSLPTPRHKQLISSALTRSNSSLCYGDIRGDEEGTYLTPTQRRNQEVRRLRMELSKALETVQERDMEIGRLRGELRKAKERGWETGSVTDSGNCEEGVGWEGLGLGSVSTSPAPGWEGGSQGEGEKSQGDNIDFELMENTLREEEEMRQQLEVINEGLKERVKELEEELEKEKAREKELKRKHEEEISRNQLEHCSKLEDLVKELGASAVRCARQQELVEGKQVKVEELMKKVEDLDKVEKLLEDKEEEIKKREDNAKINEENIQVMQVQIQSYKDKESKAINQKTNEDLKDDQRQQQIEERQEKLIEMENILLEKERQLNERECELKQKESSLQQLENDAELTKDIEKDSSNERKTRPEEKMTDSSIGNKQEAKYYAHPCAKKSFDDTIEASNLVKKSTDNIPKATTVNAGEIDITDGVKSDVNIESDEPKYEGDIKNAGITVSEMVKTSDTDVSNRCDTDSDTGNVTANKTNIEAEPKNNTTTHVEMTEKKTSLPANAAVSHKESKDSTNNSLTENSSKATLVKESEKLNCETTGSKQDTIVSEIAADDLQSVKKDTRVCERAADDLQNAKQDTTVCEIDADDLQSVKSATSAVSSLCDAECQTLQNNDSPQEDQPAPAASINICDNHVHYTFQFLKRSIYYFLTDKENKAYHLRSIQRLLQFSDVENGFISNHSNKY